MEKRPQWECREVLDGVAGPPFTMRGRTLSAQEVSLAAAKHLDDKDWQRGLIRFQDWQVGSLDGSRRVIDVHTSYDTWARFEVLLSLRRDYLIQTFQEVPSHAS